jgi:hypothetical protein
MEEAVPCSLSAKARLPAAEMIRQQWSDKG